MLKGVTMLKRMFNKKVADDLVVWEALLMSLFTLVGAVIGSHIASIVFGP